VSDLRGTWYVVPTTFREDGSLDLESQRHLVAAAVRWGVDGLTAMGVTSEASALSPDERAAALSAVFEAAGSTPVVVGCSAGTGGEAAELADGARRLGARAAMVAAPSGFPDPGALPAFYGEVAERGGLELVVQDEPAATGVKMTVEVVLRSLETSGATTVKLEDPPTPPKIAALLEERPDLRVFGGLGGTFALDELRAGACGTMTGFAFPEILGAVREAWEAGERDRAAKMFEGYGSLIRFEWEAGLPIRKELLRRRGVIATAATRRSAAAPSGGELDAVLDRVDVRPGPDRLRVG
jgi:4-hydroxy-tetrahydrodipicolinate synthase